MNTARELDLQDRYVNSKATKYYLLADDISSAIATINLFTKVSLQLILITSKGWHRNSRRPR